MQLTRESLLGLAGRGSRFLVDMVLPPQCPTCDATVTAPGLFCAACFRKAGFILEPCCSRCGSGFSSEDLGGSERACSGCREAPPPWRQARAAFTYDEFSRRLVLPLKYADRTENARTLGMHMARAGAGLLRGADLLVPVPLHRRRLCVRRYNQAALLARHVGRASGVPVLVDALARLRSTHSLAASRRQDRAAIVAGAIACRPHRAESLRGRRVVLLDDVLTTGATAGECVQALMAAGAASVDLLVAARAAPASHRN